MLQNTGVISTVLGSCSVAMVQEPPTVTITMADQKKNTTVIVCAIRQGAAMVDELQR